MPAKKTDRPKGKTRRTSSRSSASFPCPNPDAPLSLTAIVDRMESDAAFAEFIRDLLCKSYTSQSARKCLDSYCKITTAELTDLCVPKPCHKNMMQFCTVPPPTGTTTLLLLAIPARRFARKR
jgi:hypothetical protein